MTDNILQVLFWTAIFLIINSYIIYPLFIILFSKFPRKINTDNHCPHVSILIAAYNEEKVIEERLNNISKSNYDFDKIEVLVGSDNSVDKTNKILMEAEKKYKWLRVFIFEKRSGKAGIINKLIVEAKNDIVVFSDANTVFEKNALRNLVVGFAEKKIGGICGKLILKDTNTDDFKGVEEEVYWKLETFIKKAEGKLGILIGANGGIFAIRKTLFSRIPIKNGVTDDLFISLQPLVKGYKVVYNENALAYEPVGENVKEEFKRKVRFSATNFQTIIYIISLLSLFKPLIAYAFFSHKVSRWFFPIFLIVLFISNFFISELHIFFEVVFIIQIAIYVTALIGGILAKFRIRLIPFSLVYFFIVSNIALLFGLVKFIFGKHSVIWERTSR